MNERVNRMAAEGIVKYHCIWHRESPCFVEDRALQKLNFWRSRLYEKGLIGVNEDHFGFGNISYRIGQDTSRLQDAEKGVNDRDPRFVITATQTGHLARLNAEHLVLVTRFSLQENSVECYGQSRASSEALTHAILYRGDELCNAVIHIHNRKIWERARDSYPLTDPQAEYGTPELAEAIAGVISDLKKMRSGGNEQTGGTIILGGHRDGIIVFDNSLDKAGDATVKLMERFAVGER